MNFYSSLLDSALGGQLAQVTMPLRSYKPLPLSQRDDFLAPAGGYLSLLVAGPEAGEAVHCVPNRAGETWHSERWSEVACMCFSYSPQCPFKEAMKKYVKISHFPQITTIVFCQSLYVTQRGRAACQVYGIRQLSLMGFPITKNTMQDLSYNDSGDHHRCHHQSNTSHCIILSGETPGLPQPAHLCISHALSTSQTLLATLLKDLQSQHQNGLPMANQRQEPQRIREDGLPVSCLDH